MCKQALTKEPVLMFSDFRNEFILKTDASEKNLGALLSQELGTEDRPVTFASRQLTDAESCYSALERELLAIIWAVEHFRPYVFSKKIHY